MDRSKKIEVIKLITTIHEGLVDSKLDETIITKFDKEIKLLSKYLNVSNIATCIFSIIFNCALEDGDMSVKRLSRFLDLKLSGLYDFKDIFQELITHQLLELVDEDEKDFFFKCEYSVPDKIVKAVLENLDIKTKSVDKEVDIVQFLLNIYPAYVSRSLKQYTLWEFVKVIDRVEKKYSSIKLPQKLKRLELSTDERAFIYVISQRFRTGEPSCNLSKLIKDFYDDGYYHQKINGFISGDNVFQKNGLLRIPSSGYTDQISVSLTDKMKKLIFDDNFSLLNNNTKSEFLNLIKHSTINSKQLFFNKELEANLEFFRKSITAENLSRITSTLKERKLNTNVISIFEGVSGTGKTEAAKQLALQLQYDIFVVDFSKMKSEFYSVSQKLVKQTFLDIKNACIENDNPIIILFNEADSLFHRRMPVNSVNGAISNMENEIQNILLEALEDVPENAVFILTSNKIESMDEALYRRLLFKIKFDVPDKSVLKQIVKSKINVLSDDQIDDLVNRFQFTGGLIDNVASKIVMNEIINNQIPTFEQVLGFFQSERATSVVRQKVGFA